LKATGRSTISSARPGSEGGRPRVYFIGKLRAHLVVDASGIEAVWRAIAGHSTVAASSM